MLCDAISAGYAEGGGMGGQDGSGEAFVRRASVVFATELLTPMLQRATTAPEEIRALIAEFRDSLDSLDRLIPIAPGGERVPLRGAGQSGPGAFPGTLPHASQNFHPGASAAGHRPSNGGLEHGARDGDALDDVGRNQRSRLRELAMLETMAREERPYALQQITAALDARGFSDTSGAVVSQLHRLKKLGIIDQPANGMYALTDQGLAHLRRLRTSFGGLIGTGEPR